MKRSILLVGLLAVAGLVLSACVGAPAPTAGQSSSVAVSNSSLDTSYDKALPVRNQLLLGTLQLEETAQPLTTEQAATLLPLWQGIRGTMNSGASAQAETDALLRQIEAGLSQEQLAAIRDMRLTQTELQDWARSQGIALGSESGGMGSGEPGSGQNLSPEERATRQAARGGTGETGGLSRALVDAVIALLEAKKGN